MRGGGVKALLDVYVGNASFFKCSLREAAKKSFSLREDTHKKGVFLVVGPLRGGGDNPPDH